ncbi:hypothetical protein L228DRAFT_250404 [Xylona heveae TC161]|uniref:HIT-type domain-containing protein n=1 Tax=Xylona heveae (strain CBS 132557 / TC161) TaxID=1328760 RepID=A0A165A5M5_XYLHT|nr:hypothetical protein L228DRAFT_250404 [Xylona heveae TC161]KZF19986.1 hypothetical protein L228DRAFT_250404 [Xylona heveae TC161]
MTLCEVCNQEVSKYKCPTCRLQYCSIACYKKHKTAHEVSSGGDVQAAPFAQLSSAGFEAASTNVPSPIVDTPETKPPQATVEGFAALPASEELAQLLKAYPNLQKQLHEIYECTLETAAASSFLPRHESSRGRGFRGRGRGRGGRGGRDGGRDRPWTPEKGIKDGLYSYRRAKVAGGEREAGLLAFAELVLKLCPPPRSDAG